MEFFLIFRNIKKQVFNSVYKNSPSKVYNGCGILDFMKILLTGGGTGGHFYPLIAVAEAIRKEVKNQQILEPEIFFMSNDPYSAKVLFDNNIKFIKVSTGKVRVYFSILNYIDKVKILWGAVLGLIKVFSIYPDVIFSKGGYTSFPATFAGKILGIPVIIHESDTVPGRANAWASKFAKKIAISFPEAAEYFPKEKVAWTGCPIRKEIMHAAKDGGRVFLELNDPVPVILILGGSQGSQIINDAIIEALPKLVEKYYIIHQTGKKNYKEMSTTAKVVLEKNALGYRYKPFDYLNDLSMRMSAGAADVVISRAGSTIFEIAAWGIPSILIPISESNADHQRKNAFNYARSGAATVIEENNLGSEVIVAEIDRLMQRPEERKQMSEAASQFAHVDAADLIAKEILNIALTHEN